jgi:hypothetical protein
LVATETALLRRNDLPPRLVQHLEVVQEGIQEYWRAQQNRPPQSQEYLGYDGFHAVVDTLRAQSDLLQLSQNPACMNSEKCMVA